MRIPSDVPPTELLTALIGASTDLIVVVDAACDIRDANDVVERVLGRPRETWLGESLTGFVHPDDRMALVEQLGRVWTEFGEPTWPIVFRAAHACGYWVSLEIAGAERVDLVDGPGTVVVVRDVTQRVQIERRLRETCQELDFAVSHDPLTQLPNREVLLARLDVLGRRRKACDGPAHLIMVKVWDLDALREARGVDETRSVLRTLTAELSAETATDGYLAVDGVGEFVLVIEPGPTSADVEELATRLLELAELSSHGQRVEPVLSVGVSTLRPGQTAGAALDGVACAAAVGRRREASAPVVVDEVPQGVAPPRVPASTAMHQALESHELELWYQPILDTRSDHVEGFEGLLRWIHPRSGVLNAYEFLPDVEGTEVMVDIGEFVLEQGCSQLARWQSRFGSDAPSVSLNVSARQLRQTDFADRVHDELRRSGARPEGLCLELTETQALGNESHAVTQMSALRDLGVRVALDDFGTGYSSLHHLHRIRADVLKIDRAFIDLLGHDPGANAIVKASVELGAAFEMITVAEGVTTVAQRRLLQSMGCDCIQGFLIAPAVPAHAAEAMLRARRRGVDLASADSLVTIDQAAQVLSSIDDGYQPSDDEVAALAGVTSSEVSTSMMPPRSNTNRHPSEGRDECGAPLFARGNTAIR